jgi:hypothetical protein
MARGRLFGGQEFDIGEVSDGLEAIIGCDEDVFAELKSQTEGKCIRIGNVSVHFQGRCAERVAGGSGDDLNLTGEPAENSFLFRCAGAFSNVARDFSPLHCGYSYFAASGDAIF